MIKKPKNEKTMKYLFQAAAVVATAIMLPFPSVAQDLPDGAYATKNDGGVGVLLIDNGRANLTIIGNGCVGELEGILQPRSNGTISFMQETGNASCELTLEESDEGLAWIAPGRGCSYFHGASCSFAGIVVERTVSQSSSAIDEGFQQLDEIARREIQQALQRSGFYSGRVDGLTGRGTRQAIIELGKAVLAGGNDVRLDRSRDVRELLIQQLNAVPIEPQSFFGEWNCDGSNYVFNADGYQTYSGQNALPYRQVEEFSPGTFGLTFVDGYRLSLMSVTDHDMIWSSPASGDTFSCTRVAGAPQQAEISVPMNQLTTSPLGDDASNIQLSVPFVGRWSCRSEYTDELLTLAFSETGATAEEIALTLDYEQIFPIGQNGSAFRVEFEDDQFSHIFELSDGAMFANVGGEIFECVSL